jgi:hypothetical protein
MGFMILAAIFGLTVAGSVVQFAVLRRTSFSLRAALVSGILAVLLVLLVATIVGYFVARVRINDHYEFNSVFASIVIVGPATAGALVGAVGGGLVARYLLLDRS